jgi:hypothetical protein
MATAAIGIDINTCQGGSVKEILEVRLDDVRFDGKTQHRAAVSQAVVNQYAALMASGIDFPPVTVWFDGHEYWLTDGFHRASAAQAIGWTSIRANVRYGTLHDAQWDSYAANSLHGLRRTHAEVERVIGLALKHSNSETLSNVQLAKHLGIPETTLRRWRQKASPPDPANGNIRIVKRGGSTYSLCTERIGKSKTPVPAKTRTTLRRELSEMKEHASPNVRRILNIIGNWALNAATPKDSLDAIEQALRGGTE